MSTNAPARRGFLRSLASLPLIGGGVTLIGSPTAAAVPVTNDLLNSYEAWLFFERRWLRFERYGRAAIGGGWDNDWAFVPRHYLKEEYAGVGGDLVLSNNPGGAFHGADTLPASGRAAVVLAAAGCDWTQTEDGR